jgi:hypothetical protein
MGNKKGHQKPAQINNARNWSFQYWQSFIIYKYFQLPQGLENQNARKMGRCKTNVLVLSHNLTALVFMLRQNFSCSRSTNSKWLLHRVILIVTASLNSGQN